MGAAGTSRRKGNRKLTRSWAGVVTHGNQDAANALGFTTERLVKNPTMGSLILLAHSDFMRYDLLELVQTFCPPIFKSIQTNVAFEETIALLLTCFISISRAGHVVSLPVSMTLPFSAILPPLASAHPDPAMRHLIFRLLSVVLSLFMHKYRLQVLEDLLTNTAVHAPQIRVAAIGLVKDSVLKALSSSPPNCDAFGTSQFLDRLGPVLFRPEPLDLFQSTDFDIEEFVQSSEPKRLIESLALYYVIMQRDTDNRVRSFSFLICVSSATQQYEDWYTGSSQDCEG